MSNVQRICTQCGKTGPLEARYCPHCGYDAQAALPVVQRSNLPMLIGKAALPILAGAASLALRAGWKLLQDYLSQAAPENVNSVTPAQRSVPATTTGNASLRRPGTRIRIRSAWAVGDANGVWRQGSSEHTIEITE